MSREVRREKETHYEKVRRGGEVGRVKGWMRAFNETVVERSVEDVN